jgi:serine/threonine protein kinase/formylglycine-generating enzyme required for sulfatase activity
VHSDSNRAETIQMAAQRMPAGERELFVRRECGADAQLAERILGEIDRGRRYRQPETIGPYRILSVLGEGGMGTVYVAEQREPVRRRVALKVIRRTVATREVLGRFELERQALAIMNHPNIAKVLDAGSDEEGQPYFAMELVKGDPLTEYCDRNRLTIAERLRLFVQVCNGVQHAHHKGVIHRDLKPGNVLVEILDDKPVARIIDFGLARATNHLMLQQSLFTEIGQLIGTPEYMSPEQAEMTGTDVDTRSDVYSLGVLLYELLTGTLPFSARDLRKAGLMAIQSRIREEEPPKPSKRVSTVHGTPDDLADRRRLSSMALAKELREDLDWVVMRCLEKDRARRYQAAVEVAADIERHLSGEPVVAGPPSAAYRVRKFVRRYRVVVGGAALLFLVMAVALGFVLQAKFVADKQRDLANSAQKSAEEERRRAEAVGDRLRRLAGVFQTLALADQTNDHLEHAKSLMPLAPHRVEEAQHWLESARKFAAGARGALLPDVDDAQRQRLQDEADGKLTARLQQLAPHLGSGCEVERRLAELRADAAMIARLWSETTARVLAQWQIALPQQEWLVPIGPDPESGLEEFAVLQTGQTPVREADERFPVTEEMAVVLVLIPGGSGYVGAVDGDPQGTPLEEPTQVLLAPYFLGKFEITQDQWYRMTGECPSRWTAKLEQRFEENGLDGRNPVEQVSWTTATTGLARFGLLLPTEAQWEFAIRGGSPTRLIWWTGSDRGSLERPRPAENLCDASTERGGATFPPLSEWPEYEDGYFLHAPVGSFRANGYGLFDMAGNVREHCRDAWPSHPSAPHPAPRAGDGLRDGGGSAHAARGSSWNTGVGDARSSQRRSIGSATAFDNIGMRAARAIER